MTIIRFVTCLFKKFSHGSSICLHTKYSLAVLHENALSLFSLASKKVIEISWITMTSGIPTFNNVFALLVISILVCVMGHEDSWWQPKV